MLQPQQIAPEWLTKQDLQGSDTDGKINSGGRRAHLPDWARRGTKALTMGANL